MKKHSVLYLLLLILILMNGFLLFNYLGKPNNKNHQGSKKGPMEFIVKELNFDNQQMSEIEKLVEMQQGEMRDNSNEIIQLKESLFSNISNENVKESVLDSITSLIALKEKERELLVFSHLREIHDLCNKKQKKKFNKIVQDALRKGTPKKERPHGKGKPPI